MMSFECILKTLLKDKMPKKCINIFKKMETASEFAVSSEGKISQSHYV